MADPGRVPGTISVDKSALTPGDLTVSWAQSCSAGADDYGIYEGEIGVWYSHTTLDCMDGGPLLEEQVTPAVGDQYYLGVAHSEWRGEGSYGKPEKLMQILILVATLALSLATALLTASGILSVLLHLMARLR